MLKQKNLHEEIKNLWRAVFFVIISILLGSFLIEEGWRPIESKRINILGSNNIQSKTLIEAVGFPFLQPLFAFKPIELEEALLKKLPIKSIVIRRQILPLGLQIELQETQPIAYATRRTVSGLENGMLDEDGSWIPMDIANKGRLPSTNLIVEGWIPREKNRIATLIAEKENLGSEIKKIFLSSSGELSIETKALGIIHLGVDRDKFEKQLRAISHLNLLLPNTLLKKEGTNIDLTDPAKPELQMKNL